MKPTDAQIGQAGVLLVQHKLLLYGIESAALTTEEDDRQEAEADELAFEWFSSHVGSVANPHERELTMEEIKEQQAHFRGLMEKE